MDARFIILLLSRLPFSIQRSFVIDTTATTALRSQAQ